MSCASTWLPVSSRQLTCDVSMLYTSNQSEGESGFAFPEGLPEGRLASAASRPEGNPEGKANPDSPELWLEVYHSLLFYLNGTLREGMIIPSLNLRESMNILTLKVGEGMNILTLKVGEGMNIPSWLMKYL